jgi:hypothetical protein
MSRTKLLSQDHRALIDAVLRSDLYSFLQAIFPLVSGGTQLLLNWHIEAMAEAISRSFAVRPDGSLLRCRRAV